MIRTFCIYENKSKYLLSRRFHWNILFDFRGFFSKHFDHVHLFRYPTDRLSNQCPFSLLKLSEKILVAWRNIIPSGAAFVNSFHTKAYVATRFSLKGEGRLSRHFSTNNKAVISGVLVQDAA